MASEDGSNAAGTDHPRLPPDDPALDPAANYDYRDESIERPDLVEELSARIDGEVRFDEYSRQLYATDASAYEVLPIGVVFPRSTADVAQTVAHCAEQGVPVLPRGGGTSLAGQSVNEAVVLDFTRYMDEVIDVDPASSRVRVQPGVILEALNESLSPHELKFAPDPAWGDKSAIGGAIGNNSTGSHSLVYGKTDAYIESCEVVLADGTVTRFGPTSMADLRDMAEGSGSDVSDRETAIAETVIDLLEHQADDIDAAFPDLKRNVSGYNLDRLVAEYRGVQPSGLESDDHGVNLARLLAGSEGTLGIVTEAELSLEPVPETKSVALLTYDDLADALADVAPILEHEPSAVEVMDDVLLDLARDTEEFGTVVDMLPSGTDSVLLVEFYAPSDEAGRDAVAGLLADRCPSVDAAGTVPTAGVTVDAPRYARDALEAHEDEERARFWKMRKSGLPILLSRTTDEKHIAFIEDTAVPPHHLPEYVERFQEILADHDTFASYYAHAGPGVLHIRPLINTKRLEGVEAMADIADRVTDLVVEFGGSVSGEHGDGRARTVWNRKLYGDHVWGLFRELKSAFDPDWLLNPGQVCGDVSMTEHLRFDTNYGYEQSFDPTLAWPNDNGMQGMVELCHGCGGCRGDQHTTGGIMCPTYRAANEEILSTRGRANMLRAAMSGGVAALQREATEAVDAEFLHEVLDLCIGCKGCSRDCPSEVDLAKLKAEVTHAHHQKHGASLRDRIFANVGTIARLGSLTEPLSNWMQSLPGSGRVAERTIGVASARDLPRYQRPTLQEWMHARGEMVSPDATDRHVLFLPDVYTNYSSPGIGRSAIRVLEEAGVHVVLAPCHDTGRPAFSKGFLEKARRRAETVVSQLEDRVGEGWEIVVAEPSDAVMLQSDYIDLLGQRATPVSEATYGFAEYLETHSLSVPSGTRELVYHGHCHQQSDGRASATAAVLQRAGHAVTTLDSTCCGMAGSFGYEAEHYSLSMAIGEILFDQIATAEGDVVAPGTSCRAQLEHGGIDAEHPAEVLAATLE